MSEKHRRPAVFLTGASSGIGRVLALRLMEEGYEVWGTSRDKKRLENLPGLHAIELDFAKPESVSKAWAQALVEAGEIDIIIQNAGQGIFGSIEEMGVEESRSQWVSVVEGPLLLLQLAAAHLRPTQQGWIIGISSLAAEMPMPFFAHYSAGKAAFSALLQGLWMELRPFGVRVVDFRPGDIRTPFNESVPRLLPPGSPYQAETAKAWEKSCVLIAAAPEPEVVAERIIRLLGDQDVSPVQRCGSFFQAVLAPLGVRLLPRGLLLQITRRYFGLG
jgi:short-subunit dehydrogenase